MAFFFCGFILVAGTAAWAQQPGKMPRIGFLGAAPASALANRPEGLRLGLRELGYEEGKNIIIEYRYAEGKIDQLPAVAAKRLFAANSTIFFALAIVRRPQKARTTHEN